MNIKRLVPLKQFFFLLFVFVMTFPLAQANRDAAASSGFTRTIKSGLEAACDWLPFGGNAMKKFFGLGQEETLGKILKKTDSSDTKLMKMAKSAKNRLFR